MLKFRMSIVIERHQEKNANENHRLEEHDGVHASNKGFLPRMSEHPHINIDM